MKALLGLVAFALLWVAPASAATLRTDVSAREVEVGETITVQLTAVLDDGERSSGQPTLPVDGAAEVHGPSIRTQRRVTMRNFDVSSEESLVATFTVTPTKVGRITIGPGAFPLGGKTLRGESIVVTVREPNPNTQRSRGTPRDPFDDPFFDAFDLWRGGPRRGLGLPSAPDGLQLEHAPDATAFLHARVSKKRVVVGEPITLEIYAYGSRGAFVEVSPIEPATPGFLSYPVIETSHEQPRFQVEIDGRNFLVQKFREIVLVPIQTGTATIGSMRVVLRGNGRNYPARGSQFGLTIESVPIDIEVVEPHAAGRPDGYVPGNVGSFELSAEVTPTTLTVGEHIELRVTVRGTGNLPSTLVLPSSDALVWEKPTTKGDPSFEDGRLGGTRTFTYTAEARRAGSIELGAVRLPLYDPARGRYEVAEAKLPTLEIGPAKNGAAPTASTEPPDAGTGRAPLPVRSKLTPFRAEEPGSGRDLALLALALPLAPLLVYGLLRLARALGARGARRARPSDKRRLNEAKTLLANGDAAGYLRELEALLYESIERSTSLKARAVLKDHLPRELEKRGVAASLATGIGAFARELDTARFDTIGDERARQGHLEALGSRLGEITRGLGDSGKRRKDPTRAAATVALLFGMLTLPASARATEPNGVFAEATSALEAEQTDAAIARLESLADSGFRHPTVAYQRGLAYLRRSSEPTAEPGDLGQAAAGFREALTLDSRDADAARGLEEVRLRVARRSGKAQSLDSDTVGLGLRALLAVSPFVCAVLALISSVAATLGLSLAFFGPKALHRAGALTAAIGGVALVLTAPLYFASKQARDSSPLAIVVAPRATLFDAGGRALGGVAPLSEGAEVRLVGERGGLVEIALETGTSWVERRQLRILP